MGLKTVKLVFCVSITGIEYGIVLNLHNLGKEASTSLTCTVLHVLYLQHSYLQNGPPFQPQPILFLTPSPKTNTMFYLNIRQSWNHHKKGLLPLPLFEQQKCLHGWGPFLANFAPCCITNQKLIPVGVKYVMSNFLCMILI